MISSTIMYGLKIICETTGIVILFLHFCKKKRQLLPPATKLGQGYIFTGVCDSAHGGGGGWVPGPGGGPAPGGVFLQVVPGGDPLGRLLLRAVRILLECILVLNFM